MTSLRDDAPDQVDVFDLLGTKLGSFQKTRTLQFKNEGVYFLIISRNRKEERVKVLVE